MKIERRTRISGIGGLVAVAALVVGFGAGCDAGEPEDGVEQTSSELFTPPKTFTLHNYQTNLCLGVRAGTPTAGTTLVVWNCDQSTNQSWQSTTTSNGRTKMNNKVAANRCLDITRGQYVTYTNGSAVDIDYCDAPTAQAWTVTPSGTDFWGHQCYQFADQYGPHNIPLVMGVSGGSTAGGASVIMWETFNNPNTHPDQYWCVY